MNRTVIFLANGFEEIEALTVVDLLRRAQIEINTVSISDSLEVTGSHNITVKADKLFGDVNFDEVDMIILPGGMPGTSNLFEYEPLREKITEFNNSGKLLSAICAAPTVYGRMGLLDGKKACCFPGCEVDLKGADVQTSEVTFDDNFITSRGMGTAIPFGLAIIEKFQGKKAADDMAARIVYKQ